MSEHHNSSLNQGYFYIKGKLHEVFLTKEKLSIIPLKKSKNAKKAAKSLVVDEEIHSKDITSSEDESSLIQTQAAQTLSPPGVRTYHVASDILGLHLNYKKTKQTDQERSVIGFTLITCSKKGHKLTVQKLKLYAEDSCLCSQWFTKIKSHLQDIKNRPKNIFVIVNPCSGKGKADRVYTKKIAPLFLDCGLKIDILKTMYPRHAWEHTKTMNLSPYDCVVCVGGDGIVHEVLNGLVEKTQAENDIDLKNLPDDFTPVKLSIPIGIIPAGSTDVIVYSAQGINDPITAACHVILGNQQPLDLCSLQKDNQLQRFAFSSAYGYLGDVLRFSEKCRWMGPRRYKWAAFKALCNLRAIDVEVSFVTSPNSSSHPRDNTRCRKGCDVCSSEHPILNTTTERQTIHCPAVGVSLITLPSPCDISPEGPSPTCHLADGCTDLIIVKKCSKAQMYNHIRRNTGNGDQFDFDFVETYRVKECQIKHSGPQSLGVWNVDGELLQEPALTIRVHRQLVTVYGEGIAVVTKSTGCIS